MGSAPRLAAPRFVRGPTLSATSSRDFFASSEKRLGTTMVRGKALRRSYASGGS